MDGNRRLPTTYYGEIMKDEEFIGKLKSPNRDKQTKSKKGKFWCWGCDCCLIWSNQRCPVCGKRDLSKHQKKGWQ